MSFRWTLPWFVALAVIACSNSATTDEPLAPAGDTAAMASVAATGTAPAFTPLIVDEAGELEGPEGGRIRYLRRGQGRGADRPSVIIVDGLNLIEPLGRALEAAMEVVYLVGVEPDAAAPAASAVGRIHIDRIEALRAHLALPRITLVGHSQGALYALEYALAYPEPVASLVVMDGLYDHGGVIREHLTVLRHHLAEEDADGNAAVIAELQRIVKLEQLGLLDFLRSFEARLYLTKGKQLVGIRQGIEKTGTIMRELEARFPASGESPPPPSSGNKMMEAVLPGVRGMNLINYSVIDAAPRIGVPVLLVQGRYDEHTGMAAARELDAALPDSRLQVMEQSGHLPTFEEPEKTSRVTLDFLGFPDPPPLSPELVPADWKPSFPAPGTSTEQAEAEAASWWRQGPVKGEVFALYGGLCGAIAAGQIPPEAWRQAGVTLDEVATFEVQVCRRLAPHLPKLPALTGEQRQGP